MSQVQVALLPSAIHGIDLAGSVAVVIDVLRATTTIVHALAAGAKEVVPCSEVSEAIAIRDRLGRESCRLGGERHGLLIDGFDLDNSPFSYTPDTVAGKTVGFTTTNGTRALAAVRAADTTLIAAFVNLDAITERLRNDGRPAWILCAGTDGQVTAEDVLVAGSIAASLLGREPETEDGPGVDDIEALPANHPDAGEIAVRFSLAHARTHASRLAAMRASRGGKNLIENGFDRDIVRAAEESVPGLNVAPVFVDGRITI